MKLIRNSPAITILNLPDFVSAYFEKCSAKRNISTIILLLYIIFSCYSTNSIEWAKLCKYALSASTLHQQQQQHQKHNKGKLCSKPGGEIFPTKCHCHYVNQLYGILTHTHKTTSNKINRKI